MFHYPATKDYHPCPLRPHSNSIDLPNILHNIDLQLQRRRLESVEVQHIPQTAIRQRGAENRDIVLVTPIVHTPLIIDLLPQPMDHLTRRPIYRLFCILRRFLLLEHLVENGDHPVFE